MNETPGTSGLAKWDLERLALVDSSSGALRKLGSKIRVGVAVFPGSNVDTCATEVEAYALMTSGYRMAETEFAKAFAQAYSVGP